MDTANILENEFNAKSKKKVIYLNQESQLQKIIKFFSCVQHFF